MKHGCCETKLSSKKAGEILKDHGLNRTTIKIDLLTQLSKSSSPLSVAELHQKTGKSCDISSIFRSMSQFKEKGIVKEINLGEDFFRYEVATLEPHHHNHHHHHVRCRKCGAIKLIEKCDITIFSKMISKLGFSEMEHHLEFTGLCSKCS
jgi:Fur family ferric uptake transcriptional regulator